MQMQRRRVTFGLYNNFTQIENGQKYEFILGIFMMLNSENVNKTEHTTTETIIKYFKILQSFARDYIDDGRCECMLHQPWARTNVEQ